MSIKQFNFPTVIRFGENAIKEAIEVGRLVYVVVLPGATRKRLQKLKLLDLLPEDLSDAIDVEVGLQPLELPCCDMGNASWKRRLCGKAVVT
mgnify:CR=1 FL=1